MKIAIAGANAGVGRHISEALLEQGKHTIVILSRGNDLPFLSKRGAHIESVSYESQDSLVSALTGVHTVICAIGDHSVSYAAQFALAQAAITAQVTRYIPSGWSATDGGPNDTVELYRFKDPVLELLRGSEIQWSNVVNGIFINYLATPTAGIGYLKPLKFWIDIENCKATIPGDGNMELAYITVEDVATFIVKAVEVEGIWPEQLNIVGSTVTHNELIKLAESVRGKSFEVLYQNEEQLKNALVPNPPSIYVNMATLLSLALLEGRFTFEPNFNDKVQMNYTQPKEFFEKWWGKT